MTSVGTLMRQAAFGDRSGVDSQQAVSRGHALIPRTTSPIDADNIWLTGARWGGVGRMRLSTSYVQKKTAAKADAMKVRGLMRNKGLMNVPPGALPTMTLPTPLYIPLNPPVL